MNEKNIVAFLDSINRLMFAEEVSSANDVLKVRNPVVINIVPQADPRTGQPTGQMALQLIPVFFKEFLADKSSDVIFNYNKSVITVIDPLVFDFKLHAQYHQLFATTPTSPVTPVASQPGVIKLFDD